MFWGKNAAELRYCIAVEKYNNLEKAVVLQYNREKTFRVESDIRRLCCYPYPLTLLLIQVI